MPSNTPYKKLATFKGGRSKRPFAFFWNENDHYLYLERSGFISSSKERTKLYATSWEMAYHAAEMWVGSQ